MANTSITYVEEYDLEFTDDELQELETARKRPISFDEDCPETTPEKAVKFKRVNPSSLIVG